MTYPQKNGFSTINSLLINLYINLNSYSEQREILWITQIKFHLCRKKLSLIEGLTESHKIHRMPSFLRVAN